MYPISERFCAVQKLYTTLEKHSPGTQRYEEIDHAIDLALSERREPDKYFVRNVLRDSSRVLKRQRAKVKIVSFDQMGKLDGESYEPFTPPQLIDYSTPLTILEQKDTQLRLVEDAGGNRTITEATLAGLIKGETLKETAQTLDVSTSSIKIARFRLRSAASKHYNCRRAA